MPFLFSALMIRRCCWLAQGGMDSVRDYAEDLDLHLRLSEAGASILYIDAVTLIYRIHGATGRGRPPATLTPCSRPCARPFCAVAHDAGSVMRVSVLLACWNAASYVGEAVQSVLDQRPARSRSSPSTTGRRIGRPPFWRVSGAAGSDLPGEFGSRRRQPRRRRGDGRRPRLHRRRRFVDARESLPGRSKRWRRIRTSTPCSASWKPLQPGCLRTNGRGWIFRKRPSRLSPRTAC